MAQILIAEQNISIQINFLKLKNTYWLTSATVAPYWDQQLGTEGRNHFHGETHGNALRWKLK